MKVFAEVLTKADLSAGDFRSVLGNAERLNLCFAAIQQLAPPKASVVDARLRYRRRLAHVVLLSDCTQLYRVQLYRVPSCAPRAPLL